MPDRMVVTSTHKALEGKVDDGQFTTPAEVAALIAADEATDAATYLPLASGGVVSGAVEARGLTVNESDDDDVRAFVIRETDSLVYLDVYDHSDVLVGSGLSISRGGDARLTTGRILAQGDVTLNSATPSLVVHSGGTSAVLAFKTSDVDKYRINATGDDLEIYGYDRGSGAAVLVDFTAANEVDMSAAASVKVPDLEHTSGSDLGFYGTTPVAQQTGVAVSAAGVHAALVNLGLITA